MVYWDTQEVVQAIIGGAFIALAATLNLLYYGRITGISGIFNTVIKRDKSAGYAWKLCFIVGLVLIPAILGLVYPNGMALGSLNTIKFFDTNTEALSQLSVLGWIFGGLLVGWGTRMGSGCTSGHGVCGIPRFSIRSLVATITFMATGVAMATLKYYYPFFNNGSSWGETYEKIWYFISITILFVSTALVLILITFGRVSDLWKELLLSLGFGLIFGFGLVLSGMCRISKVRGFLVINSQWDPTLMFVMASAVCINVFTFYFIQKREKPLHCEKFSCPPPTGKVDLRLLTGAAIFGLGWGLSGMCPGPGLANFFVLTHALLWVAGLIVGQLAFDFSLTYYQNKQKSAQSEINEALIK